LVSKVALAVLAVVLTGCAASTVDGIGTRGSVSQSSSSSIPTPDGTPDSSSSAPPGSCHAAAYCDDFSDTGSGWDVDQQPHYYAGYDPYQGGTYHMGERTDFTVWEDAPTKVSTISPSYGITAQVQAIPGPNMAHDSFAGMLCWQHTAKDGNSAAGFLFEVSGSKAELGVWSDKDGSYTALEDETTSAFTFDGTDDLSITCMLNGTSAVLSMMVNGQTVLHTTYPASGGVPWEVADGVGLVAGGKGSDVFYDNFAVNPA
jgi:hypothetical protein